MNVQWQVIGSQCVSGDGGQRLAVTIGTLCRFMKASRTLKLKKEVEECGSKKN